MTNELKIEYYLSQLDRELHSLSVSQRAEIVTEIKSHIRDSMESANAKPVEQILQDLVLSVDQSWFGHAGLGRYRVDALGFGDCEPAVDETSFARPRFYGLRNCPVIRPAGAFFRSGSFTCECYSFS